MIKAILFALSIPKRKNTPHCKSSLKSTKMSLYGTRVMRPLMISQIQSSFSKKKDWTKSKILNGTIREPSMKTRQK